VAAAVTETGLVTLWQIDSDLPSIQEIAQFETGCADGLRDAALSGDGTHLIVSGDLGGCTSVLDVSSQQSVELRNEGFSTVSMNRDGDIWLYNKTELICYSNLDTGEEGCTRPPIDWLDGIWGLAINPENELLAGIFRFGPTYLADLDGNILVEFEGDGAAVAFSEDNRFLLTGTYTGHVNIYGVLE
jgi:hypothetical protein